MMCDTLAQMYINRVEWYLIDKYDVYVSFDSDGADEYWFDPGDIEDDPGVISINNSRSITEQLHTLLHESGHVALRVKPEDFRSAFPIPDRETVKGRIEILREEVLAWDQAEFIAQSLNISLDRESWGASYADALERYVKWIMREVDDEE